MTLRFAKVIFGKDTRGRMARGVLANVYDKGAVALVQLLSIPLLSRAWGVDVYGTWLLLMTVPTYVALSDLGFGSSAGVTITRSLIRGRHNIALVALHSTTVVTGCIILFGLTTVAISLLILGFGNYNFGLINQTSLSLSFILISIYAVLCAQMNIVSMVYRSTNRFAESMFFSGTLIFIEGLALFSVVALGGSILASAFAYLIIRLIGLIYYVEKLKRREPWVTMGVADARISMMRALLKPSIAAFSLTLASSVLLQGMILALAASAGVANVAVFGAARSISRVPLQFSGLFLRPSLPEYTRALTEGNVALVSNLTRVNLLAALVFTVPFGLSLAFFGRQILSIASGGSLDAKSDWLFLVLGVAATANACWLALSAPLIAMNRQAQFSYLYLCLSFVAVAVVALISTPDAVVAASSMALVEIILLIKLLHSKSIARA